MRKATSESWRISLSVSCDTRLRIYRTAAAANPGPRPIVGVRNEAGRDGVLQDVLQRGLEMLLRLAQSRGKALAEDVVAASVDRVEGAGVLAVEIAHAGREIRLWRLDDEVVVVAHQAASVEAPAVPERHEAKLEEEGAAVVIVQEAELLVVAARRDVVPRAGCEIATGDAAASRSAQVCYSRVTCQAPAVARVDASGKDRFSVPHGAGASSHAFASAVHAAAFHVGRIVQVRVGRSGHVRCQAPAVAVLAAAFRAAWGARHRTWPRRPCRFETPAERRCPRRLSCDALAD